MGAAMTPAQSQQIAQCVKWIEQYGYTPKQIIIMGYSRAAADEAASIVKAKRAGV